jgi:hypothetical protein
MVRPDAYHSGQHLKGPPLCPAPALARLFDQAEKACKGTNALTYSNVCREKGSLLSFVYKFGREACQCC